MLLFAAAAFACAGVEKSERISFFTSLLGCRTDALLLAVEGAWKSRLNKSFSGSGAFGACCCARACPGPGMGGARGEEVRPAIAVESN